MKTAAPHTRILDLHAKRSQTPDQPAAEHSDYVALPDDLQYSEPNDYAFLRTYVEFSRRWSPRSPAASHEAVALQVLSAAAAGRVVFHYGERHRTSLYQLLVASSTLYAKTTVANIASDLLRAAGLQRVLIGRATPQSFFDQCLEKVPSDYATLSTQIQESIQDRLRNAAQRAWTADEFGAWAAAMLREGSVSYDFRSLLLEIYDSPHTVERSTRTHGILPLQQPTLALFALSTYADVQRIAGSRSPFWRDGLLARFDFITTAETEQHSNAPFPKGQRVLPAELVEGLQAYDAMLGRAQVRIVPVTEDGPKKERVLRYDPVIERQPEFVVTLSDEVYEAVERYDNWLRDTIGAGLVDDLHASYGRMAARALRIACLLASYERRERCELRDWKKAQAIMERRRQSLHWTYERLTSSAEQTERVSRTDAILRFVASGRCVTARDIQTKFRRSYPTGMPELQRELDALCAQGELHSVEGRRGRKHYAIDTRELPAGTAGKDVK
jgi:hypothetical protein